MQSQKKCKLKSASERRKEEQNHSSHQPVWHNLARNGEARGTQDSPETSPDSSSSACWWTPFAAMGCFGSASSKQTDSNDSDDSKSQKRRSDAITKQLQRDKQVQCNICTWSVWIVIEKKKEREKKRVHHRRLDGSIARAKLLIRFSLSLSVFFCCSFILGHIFFLLIPPSPRPLQCCDFSSATGLQGNTSIAAARRWWIGQINNCKANAYSSRQWILWQRTEAKNRRHQEEYSWCNIGERRRF